MDYYVIGDIHGQKNLLDKALEYVYKQNGKRVIFLGDYIDRGPDSIGVVETVMNPPEGVEFICLMGNHEEMFVNDGAFDYYYCKKFQSEVVEKGFDYFKKDWMYNLKPYHIEDVNIFAHAAFDPKLKPEDQTKTKLFWDRWYMGEDYHSETHHFTHGHTPFTNGPEQTRNRTNMDCNTKNGEQICVAKYRNGVKGPIQFCMTYSDGRQIEFSPHRL